MRGPAPCKMPGLILKERVLYLVLIPVFLPTKTSPTNPSARRLRLDGSGMIHGSAKRCKFPASADEKFVAFGSKGNRNVFPPSRLYTGTHTSLKSLQPIMKIRSSVTSPAKIGRPSKSIDTASAFTGSSVFATATEAQKSMSPEDTPRAEAYSTGMSMMPALTTSCKSVDGTWYENPIPRYTPGDSGRAWSHVDVYVKSPDPGYTANVLGPKTSLLSI